MSKRIWIVNRLSRHCAAVAAAVFVATIFTASSTAEAGVIRNHSKWIDTDGNPIDCHEGSILRVSNVFYWHCRSYTGNLGGIFGRDGAQFRNGINCYSSTDLERWTYRGRCLPYPTSGWLSEGTWHRPRVIYNAATGKYVLWFFVLTDFNVNVLTVAVGDSPIGPFSVVTGPGNPMGGDLATFLDADGRGYLAYDDETSIRVTRLSTNFQSLTTSTTVALSNAIQPFEGSSIAKYKGKYIVAGSGRAGLGWTDTSYAVANSPLGPYTYKGFMSEQSTWNSQLLGFVYIAESDTLFAMCEQWFVGPNGEQVTADQSTQLWLPVRFDAATGVARMEYVTEWDPWAGATPPSAPPAQPTNLRIVR